MADRNAEGPISQFNADEREIMKQLEADIKEEEGAEEVQTGQDDPTTAAAATQATEQAPAQAAPAAQPAAATPAAPAADTQAPQGNLKAALRAARHGEKRAKEEAERLRQENEDLRAGKAPVDTNITDEELATMEQEFPLQAKLVRRTKQLEAEVTTLRQTRQQEQPQFEPPSYDPELQEVIDTVPDLVAWQYDPAAQDKFAKAIEQDKLLLTLPDWKDKPLPERLVEVTRRVKAETTPAPRLDPAAVIAAAPTQKPAQISDFRGGAQPNAMSPDYSKMTDDQVMASLPRL